MTNEQISDQMAMYLMLGLPIPEQLMNELMVQVCEEVKQEREGRPAVNSTEVVEGV